MASTWHSIYDDIKLYTTSDRFFLEPVQNPQKILVIDRISSLTEVKDRASVQIPIPVNAYKPICGFLGTIKLISGNYLIVATYRKLVGRISGHEIFELAGSEAIPYARSQTHLSQKQKDDDAVYEKMLRSALDTPGLYLSYSYDLTHTLQRISNSSTTDFNQMSLLNRADPTFLWNSHLLKDFKDPVYSNFTVPMIQGFCHSQKIVLRSEEFTYTIISRRGIGRAGTRLFSRGVDNQGCVSNYVETEQIVERGADRASFVQTRGSIPLFWTQLPDLRYKPPPTLAPLDHVAGYTRHLHDQQARYGGHVLVNLIDQRGAEEGLESGYRCSVAAGALPLVRYEPFDFHAECRAMRYDRLNLLLDRLAHELNEFGYFLSRGGTVLQRQSGVFRTNCVDCLDRTNVVQSLLARRQLLHALKLLGVIAHDDLAAFPDFETFLKNVWADHADMISVQYSGTGALKTDFTRTGKRTYLGLLRDGINSLTRYYKNNFCDGFRQDSIDLFLGKYQVVDGEGSTAICPLEKSHDWKYYTFPSVMLVAVSMLFASVILPAEYSKETLLYLMFWGSMVGATLTFIFKNGKEFVDWPRLVPVTQEPGHPHSL